MLKRLRQLREISNQCCNLYAAGFMRTATAAIVSGTLSSRSVPPGADDSSHRSPMEFPNRERKLCRQAPIRIAASMTPLCRIMPRVAVVSCCPLKISTPDEERSEQGRTKHLQSEPEVRSTRAWWDLTRERGYAADRCLPTIRKLRSPFRAHSEPGSLSHHSTPADSPPIASRTFRILAAEIGCGCSTRE